MAAGGAASHSIGWDLFFIDLEQLVLDYEQLKASNFTTNYSLDETLLERFENAVQPLRNVLPHVHHSHSIDDATLLSDRILDQLCTMVNPLQESNRYGIDIYTHCFTTLQGLVTNE